MMMPGSLATILSQGRQRVTISRNILDNPGALAALNQLRCHRCSDINFNGWRVEPCGHIVCYNCYDCPNILQCCDQYPSTKKVMQGYRPDQFNFLQGILVCCPDEECRAEIPLEVIDEHLEEHDSETEEHNSSIEEYDSDG